MRVYAALAFLALVGAVSLMLIPTPSLSQDAADEASPSLQSSLELGKPFDQQAQQQFEQQLSFDERATLVRLRSRFALADSDCPLPTSEPTKPFYVKLKGDLTRELADTLSAAGASFLGYYPLHAHMIRARDDESLERIGGILRENSFVAGTLAQHTMDKLSLTQWQRYDSGADLSGDYNVLFWRGVDPEAVGELLGSAGITHLDGSLKGGAPMLTLRVTHDAARRVFESHLVEYVGFVGRKFATNQDSAAMSNADPATIGVSPYNLDGDGQVAGVWDAGVARESHEQYQGLGSASSPSNWPGSSRVHNVNGSASMHYHAAHVTGTIVGDGTNNAQAQGYAPKALCLVHLWNNIDAERRDAKHTFNHVADNHSWADFSGQSDDWGDYTDGTQLFDTTNRDTLICQVQSAGNYATGLGNASGSAHSKPFGNSTPTQSVPSVNAHRNGYIIAACDDSEDIAGFSSQGPGHDGRLVPQFCANGVTLESTDDDADDDYRTASGTSMSGPSTCGSVVLLSQLWRREHNDQLLTPDIGRAVLAQTARDKYNTGPDYRYGFGIVDCQAAADLILADKAGGGDRIVRGSVRDNDALEYSFSVSSSDPIHIVLSWLDIYASINASVTLTNDLDIELEEPGGTIHYPYSGVTSVSSGDHTHTFTTSGPNTRDNIELVHVDSPANGTWTLRVKGTSIPANPKPDIPNDVTGFVIASSHSISHQKLLIEDAVNGSSSVSIPDNNSSGIARAFTVNDSRVVTAVRVHARIHHERRGDLSIQLQSPSGTTVDLKTTNNGVFDDETDIIAIFPDTKQSDDDVAAFLCEPVQGTWTVTIADNTNNNTGDLHYLALELDVRTNVAPLADAGSNFDVREDDPGQLDASGTIDGDGDPIEYSWAQTGGGIALNLSSATIADPTFTAPSVTQDETVTFELTATDCAGAFTTDTVQVTVLNNAAPQADAGADFGIIAGRNGALDSSATSDAESDPLTYAWVQTSGAITINLNSTLAANPTFTAPMVTQDEQVEFELTVTDDRNDFTTDTVTVTVELNVAPNADAGPSFGLVWSAGGQLDATASSDPNTGDTLTYQWAQVGGTNTVTLSNDTDPQPTFTAPSVDDQLVFELTVMDADGLMDVDTVVVYVNETGAVPKQKSGGGGDKGGGGCSTGNDQAWLFLLLLSLVGGAFTIRRLKHE